MTSMEVQNSPQTGSLPQNQSVTRPDPDTTQLSARERTLPNWLAQVRQSQNQDPVSPDGEFLLRNPISGSVIDQDFKKEFIRPLTKELCKDNMAGRLTTNQVMRKLINKGKITFPQVFKASVIAEMYQVNFRSYAYRSYQFICGERYVKHAEDEILDTSDPNWVKICTNRFNHHCFGKSKFSRSSTTSRKSIKFMTAEQFIHYCEGNFSVNDLKILKTKCFQECKPLLWHHYGK